MSEPKKNMEKCLYFRYDPMLSFESAVGGLRILVPAKNGYVNYNLLHSVNEERNCDTWRLGKAYAFDDALVSSYELTPDGAEWDMALRLSGRADFIGGYAHGDERYDKMTLEIDGEITAAESLVAWTPFSRMRITVTSAGYDPDDSETAVLMHWKEYLIEGTKVVLNQRVEWLGDYSLGSSYMAMMPPLKALTDRVYTDADPTPREAISHYGRTPGATRAVVYGEKTGFSFSMSVPRYPSLVGGNTFSLTDNSGRPYNKMYFVVCNGADVAKGDVWETTTEYAIDNETF